MNDTTLSGPVDTVAPWTLKAISAEVRETITVAARKEGLTISQWIERRVREWTETGEPKRVSPDQPEVVPSSDRPIPTSSELRDLMQAAEAAASASGRPMTKRVASQFYGLIDERIRAARGLPAAQPAPTKDRTLQITGGTEAAD